MILFLLVQILSILIGLGFLYMAFNMLRAKKKEQERIQDPFLFYLLLGLFFVFFTFVLEYLG
jgi:heme O synthase-like polyprenyltransferase